MTANLSNNSLKVGIFGIGLEAYWSQFRGLEARLRGYVEEVAQRVARLGIEVVNLGLVDTPDRAFAAGHDFRRADVDLILLYVTTYALSSTVLPVVRRAKVPVIVLNLSPAANIDYAQLNHMGDRTKMTGEWLAFCSACPVPEIANVFERSGIPFFQVSGMLRNDSIAWNEIGDWVEAARVAHVMEHNRLGLLGHYYSGMLDIYSDLTGQCACFGGHVEILEVEELASLRREVSEGDVETRVAEFRTAFDIQNDCPAQELARAARTSIAVDILIEQHGLGSLAYYYKGTGSAENEDVISSIILGTSLLTGRGIPVAGEYEVKNVQAMKIMDAFGAGGSFTEYYAVDYSDDVILMGHDGPGHMAIAEGKTKVRPLKAYHGKVGQGLSVEMSVKHGPVTLLSIAEARNGRLKLVVAEGESVPGPILQIGNTNSRYRFSIGVRKFMNEWSAAGPAHHCAVGLGHLASKVRKLAQLLGLDFVQVC
ncbi:MAG: arabinose isomerase [Acidobacteria bacterium]|nr:MAG: arabinose isomerase [Acidobacteriota bacterium]